VGFGGIENIILALQSIATDIGAPAPAAATEAVDSLVPWMRQFSIRHKFNSRHRSFRSV